jgi:hypothetical protein
MSLSCRREVVGALEMFFSAVDIAYTFVIVVEVSTLACAFGVVPDPSSDVGDKAFRSSLRELIGDVVPHLRPFKVLVACTFAVPPLQVRLEMVTSIVTATDTLVLLLAHLAIGKIAEEFEFGAVRGLVPLKVLATFEGRSADDACVADMSAAVRFEHRLPVARRYDLSRLSVEH